MFDDSAAIELAAREGEDGLSGHLYVRTYGRSWYVQGVYKQVRAPSAAEGGAG